MKKKEMKRQILEGLISKMDDVTAEIMHDHNIEMYRDEFEELTEVEFEVKEILKKLKLEAV